MANIKGLVVAGATLVAAVGVYYGLNRVMPREVEHGELPVKPADPEVVFSGTISQAEPPPGAPAPATAPNAATPPPTVALKQAEPQAAAPSPAAPPPAQAPKSEAAVVPQPTPAPPPVETKPAPTPEAASPPKPAPKPAEPARKPAPKPSEPAQAPTSKPSPPSSETAARWWGEPGKQNPNQLNLVFAGQAAGQSAIALMFSGSFNNAGVANAVQVYDDKGKPANGHWELSPNPKMLLFRGVKPGRYTVVLNPQLKDAQGRTLGRRLSGPVSVQ